jgi:hypothetical protein
MEVRADPWLVAQIRRAGAGAQYLPIADKG